MNKQEGVAMFLVEAGSAWDRNVVAQANWIAASPKANRSGHAEASHGSAAKELPGGRSSKLTA